MLSFDFINTEWYITHKIYKDILMDKELLKEFLEKHNLFAVGIIQEENIKRLVELRDFLSIIFENVVSTGNVTEKEINDMNRYISLALYRRACKYDSEKVEVTLVPEKKDINWIMSEITSDAVNILSNFEIARIKSCENPDCRWIFYDESKNRTRRWCDDTCASLMKVRRFRAKKK